MKNKILAVLICVLTLAAVLCSCGENNKEEIVTSPKAQEEYEKYKSSLGYKINYDDVLFSLEKDKDNSRDKFTLKSGDGNTGLLITKYENSNQQDVATKLQENYKNNGYTDISSNPSALFENALSVVAVKKDGSIIENTVIENGKDVFSLEISIGTSLNDVNGEMALYSMIETFEVR